MLTCIIVDDDINAVEILTDYVHQFKGIRLMKVYTDPLKALKELSVDKQVDVIFMDIDMPGISGIELAKAIRNRIRHLLFTTAHNVFAKESYELKADGYLLKPFSFSQFAISMNDLIVTRTKKVPEAAQSVKSETTYIYVRIFTGPGKGETVKMYLKDIICAESMSNSISIYTMTKTFKSYISLKELRDELVPYSNFLQIHRSFIISADYINSILGHRAVTLKNGRTIAVGGVYRKVLVDYLKSKA